MAMVGQARPAEGTRDMPERPHSNWSATTLVAVTGGAVALKWRRILLAGECVLLTPSDEDLGFEAVFTAVSRRGSDALGLPLSTIDRLASPDKLLFEAGIKVNEKLHIARRDRVVDTYFGPNHEWYFRCRGSGLAFWPLEIREHGRTDLLIMPDDERLLVAVDAEGKASMLRLNRSVTRPLSILDRIERFTGDYRFLSNFFASPVRDEKGEYATVEHAYQAAKACNDAEWYSIAAASTPAKAKRRGNTVVVDMFWEAKRLPLMRAFLVKKFAPGSHLAYRLLATGNAELIEGNDWNDRFWGMCNGVGENHLGRLLMEIRDRLRASSPSPDDRPV